MSDDLYGEWTEKDEKPKYSPKERKKILVVDDDPGIVRALKRNLYDDGYDPIICMDGDCAISALEQQIDLVLLDIKLPKINGPEIFKMMREINPNIPIVFHTAYAGRDREDCLALNPNDYIYKGDYKIVQASIQKVIGYE